MSESDLRRARLAACGALLVLLVGARPANAGDGYDGQTRQPVHDGSGLITVQGSRTLASGGLHLDLTYDYGRNPVVLQAGGERIAELVRSTSTAELGVAYGLPAKLQVSAVLPVAFRSLPNPYGIDFKDASSTHGLGDLRVELKYLALEGAGNRPGIALALASSFPTGSGQSWVGSGAVQPSLTLVAEERLGNVLLAANAGFRARAGGAASAFDVNPSHAIIYRAGAGYELGGATLMAELFGAATLGGGPHPREANAGLRFPVLKKAFVTAGLGYGLSDAVGTPSWRFFGAVAWELDRTATATASPVEAASAPIDQPSPKDDAATAIVTRVTPTKVPAAERVVEPVLPPEKPKVAELPPPLVEPLVQAPPPPQPIRRVVVTKERLELAEAVHFITGSAKLHIDSHGLLDEIVTALKEHPEITLLAIEGHTDNVGPPRKNLKLSAARARAVLDYLVNKGIAKSRLTSNGFGQTKPIATNQTSEGRARNRRVEFNILKRR